MIENMPKMPARLESKIIAGECGLFIGSGVSATAGLPNWKNLLHKMIDTNDNTSFTSSIKDELIGMINEDRLLEVAEYLRITLKPRIFADLLETILDQKCLEPSNLHKLISSLRIKSIVTTNYDHLLEDAFYSENRSNETRVYDYTDISALAGLISENKSFILKAHGSIKNVKNVIFARSDYRKAMYNTAAFRSFFSSLFTSKTFLFIGYSMSDPDLIMILEDLSTIFEGYGQVHYALMANPGYLKKELFERRFNIEIIPYTPKNLDHPEINVFLQSIKERIDEKSATIGRMQSQLMYSQKLESLGQMAGGIAHDFNNLLGAMSGNLKLLKLKLEEGKDVSRNITTLEDVVIRAGDLTNRLLLYSRRKTPIKISTSLIKLVKESAELSISGSNVKLLIRS